MTEILAVFRSRAQATDCATRLKTFGIRASIINTPQEAGIGCGLSVKFPQADLRRAQALIVRARYSAFYGYMTVTYGYGGTRYGQFYG